MEAALAAYALFLPQFLVTIPPILIDAMFPGVWPFSSWPVHVVAVWTLTLPASAAYVWAASSALQRWQRAARRRQSA